MEEIDKIIIDSLKHLHCEFADDITSLKQFDADLVVRSMSSCLEAIIPNSTFAKSLPPSMSLKLKITTNLAEQIKDLGFQGDIGYQTILYSNEAEIRRVFMFLIERIPRESSKTASVEQTGYVPTLVKEIELKLKQSLDQCWVPTSLLRRGYYKTENGAFFYSLGNSDSLSTKKLQIPSCSQTCKDDTLKSYWIHNVPAVTHQCSAAELVPSLLFEDFRIEHNDPNFKDLVNASPLVATSINDTPIQLEVSQPLEQVPSAADQIPTENQLQKKLEAVNEQRIRCIALQEALKRAEADLNQNKLSLSQEQEELDNKLLQITLKTKTLTVISKEENFSKLQSLIESNQGKLVQLAEQWHNIQSPLLQEYKALQSTISSEDLKQQETEKQREKLKNVKHNLIADLEEKTHLESQLKQKFEQMNKGSNRAEYTQRILEIIGNIKKQNNEIDKILNDTRNVQREISSLTGQVDRSFTMSDELIFRDAKQDETARKAYKLLAQLRDECSFIIKHVADLGAVERDSRNLQDQIDTEIGKESTVKLERVSRDIQDVRKETELLQKTHF